MCEVLLDRGSGERRELAMVERAVEEMKEVARHDLRDSESTTELAPLRRKMQRGSGDPDGASRRVGCGVHGSRKIGVQNRSSASCMTSMLLLQPSTDSGE